MFVDINNLEPGDCIEYNGQNYVALYRIQHKDDSWFTRVYCIKEYIVEKYITGGAIRLGEKYNGDIKDQLVLSALTLVCDDVYPSFRYREVEKGKYKDVIGKTIIINSRDIIY